MTSRLPARLAKGSLGRALRMAAALLAICLILAPRAHADPIRASVMVSGNYSDLYSLNVSGPGVLTVRLENIPWPTRLAQLDCFIYSSSGLLHSLTGLNGSAEWRIETSGPGLFYASVLARAGGALNLGLFSINCVFEPAAALVPLPAAVWLLGSVLGLFGLRRAWPAMRFAFGSERYV